MILPVLKTPGRSYFDHNATTPLASVIATELPEWLGSWGNPSSIHQEGRRPKAALRETRKKFAEILGCSPLEIVFTGGGSEANNTVLKGVAFQHLEHCGEKLGAGVEPGRVRPERNQILISSVEHPAIKKTAESLRAFGFQVDSIPVSREGRLDLEAMESLLSEKTLLVSVMTVNNETGDIYPIAEVSRLAKKVGALVHTDAVQTLGKCRFNVEESQVDFATFSAHKFYALKGIGALYQRRNRLFQPLIHGGGQERRRRAGTENVLGVLSFGRALDFLSDSEAYNSRILKLRDQMEEQILAKISGVEIPSSRGTRVGSTSSLIIDGVDGETLLMNLDIKGFSVSTGAACSSGNPEPSPTLLAMGYSRTEAQSSLRLSLGWGTEEAEVAQLVDALVATVQRIRNLSKVGTDG